VEAILLITLLWK
jgi:replication restart DNA helicase PriA